MRSATLASWAGQPVWGVVVLDRFHADAQVSFWNAVDGSPLPHEHFTGITLKEALAALKGQLGTDPIVQSIAGTEDIVPNARLDNVLPHSVIQSPYPVLPDAVAGDGKLQLWSLQTGTLSGVPSYSYLVFGDGRVVRFVPRGYSELSGSDISRQSMLDFYPRPIDSTAIDSPAAVAAAKSTGPALGGLLRYDLTGAYPKLGPDGSWSVTALGTGQDVVLFPSNGTCAQGCRIPAPDLTSVSGWTVTDTRVNSLDIKEGNRVNIIANLRAPNKQHGSIDLPLVVNGTAWRHEQVGFFQGEAQASFSPRFDIAGTYEVQVGNYSVGVVHVTAPPRFVVTRFYLDPATPSVEGVAVLHWTISNAGGQAWQATVEPRVTGNLGIVGGQQINTAHLASSYRLLRPGESWAGNQTVSIPTTGPLDVELWINGYEEQSMVLHPRDSGT